MQFEPEPGFGVLSNPKPGFRKRNPGLQTLHVTVQEPYRDTKSYKFDCYVINLISSQRSAMTQIIVISVTTSQ
jgi:hypothetical protein